MQLTNYNKAKLEILAAIAAKAEDNLNSPSPHLSVKAKYEKVGDDWTVVSSSKTRTNKKSSDTGRLAGSIKYRVVGNVLQIETEDYGRAIDLGREPGDYAPPKDIDAWVRKKGMKDGAGFMINRKIKFFGMPPTYFLTKPVEDAVVSGGEVLITAYMKDLDAYVTQNN